MIGRGPSLALRASQVGQADGLRICWRCAVFPRTRCVRQAATEFFVHSPPARACNRARRHSGRRRAQGSAVGHARSCVTRAERRRLSGTSVTDNTEHARTFPTLARSASKGSSSFIPCLRFAPCVQKFLGGWPETCVESEPPLLVILHPAETDCHFRSVLMDGRPALFLGRPRQSLLARAGCAVVFDCLEARGRDLRAGGSRAVLGMSVWPRR